MYIYIIYIPLRWLSTMAIIHDMSRTNFCVKSLLLKLLRLIEWTILVRMI